MQSSRTADGSLPRVAWLGIGAQRCGTTWFTDLLCQHPSVALSAVPAADGIRQKELHILDRFGLGPEAVCDLYREKFSEAGEVLRGEFSPSYLRSPWAAANARHVLPETCRVFVLLRDPIARFRSAMDWKMFRSGATTTELPRDFVSDAVWAGLYELQLPLWQWLGDRLHVVFYEDLRDDPGGELARAWKFLGLDPVELANLTAPSATSVAPRFSFDESPGLKDELSSVYATTRRWAGGRWG